MSIRPLNLDPSDRKNCTVVFNVSRFEIYHASGWLMSATGDVARLDDIIGTNSLDCTFDALAKQMYLKFQETYYA